MPAAKTQCRGGRRSGAGRPAQDPSGAKRRVVLYLSPAELVHCQSLATSAPAAVRQLLAASMRR